MTIDLRTHTSTYDTDIIKDQVVDCVESYRYLGTVNDSKLTFEKTCKAVCQKGPQRLVCLRPQSCFQMDKTTRTLFYLAFIESISPFSLCVMVWQPVSAEQKNL